MKKNIAIILGMHRSGSSALAGSLFHCGIPAGKDLMEPAYDNPKGFFENKQVVSINQDILHSLGMEWDSLANFPENWANDSAMQRHKSAIRYFLESEASANDFIFIKDPRLCLTLPLWQAVLDELQFTCHYLLTLRHPQEVALSLEKRNRINPIKAGALWLCHYFLAELHTRGHQRRFIQFDKFINAPDVELEGILSMLGQAQNNKVPQAKLNSAKQFLDRQLKHESVKSLEAAASVLGLYGSIYSDMLELSERDGDADLLKKIDDSRSLFLGNLSMFVPGNIRQAYARFEFRTRTGGRLVKPVHLPVYQGLESLSVKGLSSLEDIQEIRVFPCDELCHLAVGEATLHYMDGSKETISDLRKMVSLEHGKEFIISSEDFISLVPNGAGSISSIELAVSYIRIGAGIAGQIQKMGTDIKLWFQDELITREKNLNQEVNRLQAVFDSTAEALSEKKLALEAAESLQKQLIEKLDAGESAVNTLQGHLQEKDATIALHLEHEAMLKKEVQQLLLEKTELSASLDKLQIRLQEVEGTSAGLRSISADLERQVADLSGQVAATRGSESKLAQEKSSLKQLIKTKEQLIWDLLKSAEELDTARKRALKEMMDLRLSVSYRAGMAATWPMRLVYDVFYRRPFNETNLWLFYHFMGAGLRMPGRLVRNINKKNISTLRKALRQEHPTQIYGNFVKLLAGGATTPETTGGPQSAVPKTETASLQSPSGSIQPPGPQQPVKPPVAASLPIAIFPSSPETRKTLVYMAPYLPDFDNSSGGKRATRMLEMLVEDFNVYVFTLGAKPEKYIRKLESQGVRVFRGESFDDFKAVVPHADFLVFSFFYTYFDCGKFLKLYPGAKIIIDTVDIHWVRHERSLGLWADLTEDEVRKKKILEIDVYKKADVIWAVTEQDKQAVLKEVPQAQVYIVSNVHALECAEYRDPGNYNLLFFGGFSHYPNIIAAKEIAYNIFPAIRQQVGQAKLIIAGANATEDIKNLGKLPGVEVLGFVEDTYLGELYRNTFLVLAPLQAGAGIKGKICEAISHMVPVATNAIGNEGIGLVNLHSGLIADDNEGLATLCINALKRQYDLGQMAVQAQQKLSGLVGPDAVKMNMLDSLRSDEISICIVTWNRQQLLQRCIESIETHTHGVRYRILVYSNGCTDGTREYLMAASKINPLIVPILSDTNDVFVIPNNKMMQLFPENDVVLLNNDTYVTEGWLPALRNTAYSSEEIGITGAKLLYPDGTLQEFGSELYGDGTGRNIGKWDDPNKAEYCSTKFAGYVSGCVFYVKRSTIDKIGVFDEDFHPCYCEDSDYCYTAWENGIATVVTPSCVVYHDEGATSGQDTDKGFKAYQKTNFEKFLTKHGGNLDAISTRIKLMNLKKATVDNV
jgi:GT2 family glycosyltransferase